MDHRQDSRSGPRQEVCGFDSRGGRTYDDDLTISDLESIILTGQVVERQLDRETGESKYVINGQTVAGGRAEAIVKRGTTDIGLFITIFAIG